MWFKHRAWIPAAWLLSLGNLGAVWFAAEPAEPWHATIHALLAVLFGVGGQHLMARRRAIAQHEELQGLLDQNEYLEHLAGEMESRVHALEERVGFAERLAARQRDPERPGPPPR